MITDTFTIEYDSDTDIIVEVIYSDGSTEEITPLRRNLNSDFRKLTAISEYSIDSAYSVSIYYVSNTDITDSTFVVYTEKDYSYSSSSKTNHVGIIVAVIIVVLIAIAT